MLRASQNLRLADLYERRLGGVHARSRAHLHVPEVTAGFLANPRRSEVEDVLTVPRTAPVVSRVPVGAAAGHVVGVRPVGRDPEVR